MSARVSDLSPFLEPYRDRSVNYGRPDFPLSDHLPMAVTALAAMGASDERIAQWSADYASRHALRPAAPPEHAGRVRWAAQIERDGAPATLASAVTALGAGIGAAAFHAPIRAAYAIERGDDWDLACALESWEREFVALPVVQTSYRVTLAAALDAFERVPLDRAIPDTPLIADAMRSVGERAGFATLAAAVPPGSALDALTIAAAGAFAATGNFVALHLMTGTHAVRVLSRRFASVDALMPAFWSAYAAAAIAAGVVPSVDPHVLDPLRHDDVSWSDLIARALQHDDEHVIKSTYTAWRLDTEIGDPVFATAAARFLTARGG